MNSVSFKWEGLSLLAANLAQLSLPMSRRVVREALRESGEPIRLRMAQLAPVDPDPEDGTQLKDHIGIANARSFEEGDVTIAIGPSRLTYYGSFQELGTSEFSAQPFARPAFDEGWVKALHTFSDKVWESLKRKFASRIQHGTQEIALAPTDVIGGPGGGGLV